MKGAARILRLSDRRNALVLLGSWLAAAIGGWLNISILAAIAAALVGIMSSGIWTVLEGDWEMMVMTMPVSRKGLVIGRYLRGLTCALIFGVIYMVSFRLRGSGGDEGYGLMLTAYSLLAAAISLPIGYTSWKPEGKQRAYNLSLTEAVMISGWLTRREYEIVNDTAVPLPVTLEQGRTWLAVGLAALVVSFGLSLWLEPRREW